MLGALGSQEKLWTLKFLEGEGDGKVKAQQRDVVRREHFLEVDGEGKAQPVPGATGGGVLGRGMKWRRSLTQEPRQRQVLAQGRAGLWGLGVTY